MTTWEGVEKGARRHLCRRLGRATALASWRARESDELWEDAVGHEVYLRSFSDGGDDGIGDCAGLIERLDCLDELGIDIVWVTPFCPSPQADFDYDVAYYRGVDPMSGTIDERDPEAIDGELITRSTM